MNRDRRSSSNDPTAERTAAQSTQSASGIAQDRQGTDDRGEPGRGALDTPRRYDQPIEEDDDPVMPSDDSTLNTKI
jgi:hypothetical protein